MGAGVHAATPRGSAGTATRRRRVEEPRETDRVGMAMGPGTMTGTAYDYETWILEQLLARLERSRHALVPGASRRPVFLRCDAREFPDYWDDRSADFRLLIHAAVARLAAEGLVEPRWVRAREGKEPERIDLNLSRAEEAYRRIGRTPPWAQRDRLAAVAARWSWPPGDWWERFRHDLLEALARGRALPGGLRRDADPRVLSDLLRVLDAIERLEGEVPRRVFSLQVLGDSKRLEEVLLPHLSRILAAYHPACGTEDTEDEKGIDPLAQVGLVPHPRPVLLAGPVVLEGPGGRRLDLGAFQPYVGLPPQALDAPLLAWRAQRVITVENLTSFHRLAAARPEPWLAVYLGGFHAGPGIRFLRQLAIRAPGLAFYHWGDIDLGGFRIFVHLRRLTGLPLQPYRMDVPTYRDHLHLARPFGPRYRVALAALLDDPEYAVFHDLIRVMLAEGKRLEQESVAPV